MENLEGRSAAFLTARHDGGVQALAQIGGKVVDFVGAIDLDGFARGVEGDLTVVTAS